MPALPEPGQRPPGPNQLIPAHVGEGRFLCLLHASGHTLTLTHPRYAQLHSPLAHHPALLLPAPSTALSTPAEFPEGPGPKGQPFKFPLHLSSLAEDTRDVLLPGVGGLVLCSPEGERAAGLQKPGEDSAVGRGCAAPPALLGSWRYNARKKNHDCCSKLDFL